MMFGFSIQKIENGLKGRHLIVRVVKLVLLRESLLFMRMVESLIVLVGNVLLLRHLTLIISTMAGSDMKIYRSILLDVRLCSGNHINVHSIHSNNCWFSIN